MKDIEEYSEILNDNNINIKDQLPTQEDLIDSSKFKYEKDGPLSPLGGSMPKVFVRCDSRCFREMIKDLKKPNCSYVTYVNDLVQSMEEEKIDKFPLSKISVVVKKSHESEDYGNEEKASKIANWLEIPTVYNMVGEIAGHTYNMSVDFLRKNEELLNLDFLASYDELMFMVAKKKLQKCLGYYVDSKQITQEKANSLISEFMESYIFRKYILGDEDFDFHNTGLIYNKETKNYSWAPNFDMEYISKKELDTTSLYVDMMTMERFDKERFSQIMDKFRQKLTENKKKTVYKIDKWVTDKMTSIIDTYDLIHKETEDYLK